MFDQEIMCPSSSGAVVQIQRPCKLMVHFISLINSAVAALLIKAKCRLIFHVNMQVERFNIPMFGSELVDALLRHGECEI